MERIRSPLPHDSAERKTYPLLRGLLDYFPAALAKVAQHSFNSNEKHNPGMDLHWSRDNSGDHLDALLRHVMERDLEGAAWRALAALQEQLELEGAPLAPAARYGVDPAQEDLPMFSNRLEAESPKTAPEASPPNYKGEPGEVYGGPE